MCFLVGAHGVVERLGLGVVLGEFDGVEPLLHGYYLLGEVNVGALCGGGGWVDALAVGPVVYFARCDAMAHLSVSVVVHDGADGTVNGEFLPVYTQAGELRVEVREISALEEGVIGEADTWIR